MLKRLVPIGNSLGFIIERPILDLLGIDRTTDLEVKTDGEALIIRPVRTTMSERVASLRRMMDAHAETLQKLADGDPVPGVALEALPPPEPPVEQVDAAPASKKPSRRRGKRAAEPDKPKPVWPGAELVDISTLDLSKLKPDDPSRTKALIEEIHRLEAVVAADERRLKRKR